MEEKQDSIYMMLVHIIFAEILVSERIDVVQQAIPLHIPLIFYGPMSSPPYAARLLGRDILYTLLITPRGFLMFNV